MSLRFKNLDRSSKFYKARIKRIARQVLGSDQAAKKIRGIVIRGIKQDAELPTDASVPNISEQWRKRRSKLATQNRTDRFYSSNVSNMTFTGRFLRSFKITIAKSKRIMYRLGPQGKHRGYKNLNGTRGKSVKNEDIGKGMIKSGRDWTKLGPKTKRKMEKVLATAILRRLRKDLRL